VKNDYETLIAIFDLDGTLTKKDTYIPFLLSILKKRPERLIHTLGLPFFMLFYFIKVLNNNELKEIFLYKVLSEMEIGEVAFISSKFVENLLKKGMNPLGVKLLNMHQNNRDRIIIATASFDIYVNSIAKRLGVHELICTRAETKNGRYTGKIDGLNCYGEEKLIKIKQYLGELLQARIIAYSDHLSDFPMLKFANEGYLVTPSRWCLKDKRCESFSIFKQM